jgi:hypothetical protein
MSLGAITAVTGSGLRIQTFPRRSIYHRFLTCSGPTTDFGCDAVAISAALSYCVAHDPYQTVLTGSFREAKSLSPSRPPTMLAMLARVTRKC